MGFIGFIGRRQAATAAARAGRQTRVRSRGDRGADRGGAGGPERLEARVLFTATASPLGTAVDVVWKGATVNAYQDQWVVRSQNTVGLTKLAAQRGFTGLRSLGGFGFYQFTAAVTPADMVRLAAAYPKALAKVQPNTVVRMASTVPNDPGYDQKWGLNNTGQLESDDYNHDGVVTPYNKQLYPNGLPGGAQTDFPSPPNPDENHYGITGDDVGAEKAWDITTGSDAVCVAVLDTGIDLTHPDLIDNIWTNPLDTEANGMNGDGYPGDVHGYDFFSNDSDPSDEQGHGTNVAGIIGAQGNNGQGTVGVNWNVSLIAVRVLGPDGSGSAASIIAGVNYVTNLKDHGINVVCMNESLGDEAFPQEVLQSDAIRQAGKAGVLDVVAAGNNAEDLDRSPFEPARFSTQIPTVITVAAIDNQFKIASFSNFGADTVDLGAPGVNIYSTAPHYTVTDTDALYNSNEPPYYNPPNLGLSYGYESGTSQATPSVAGIIALEAAANPAATPAQLKNALLKGVTYDPNLAAANGRAPLVRTSGVANAYGAVMAVLNPFDGADLTRSGSWVGYFGSQGSYVVGDSSTTANAFANITLDGGSPVVVSGSTRNAAALQRASDPTQRVLAYQGSATTETIHLSFTDGQAHRTTLYLVDADRKRRAETVSLVDPVTGRTLDAEGVANFTKGEYLSWDLRGALDLVISANAGTTGGAAYSGLFFDAPPTKPIAFQGDDAGTTGANWRNTYGSQGSFIAGDNNTGTLPAYVSGFNIAGGTAQTIRATTRDPRGLQKTFDLTHNVEAYYANPTSLDVNVNIADGLLHTVTLYVADYDNRRRAERVSAIDIATGAVMAVQNVDSFNKAGHFVSFNVTGPTTFRVTKTAGPSAVVSGVFFDAVFGSNAHFAGTNATLGGDWMSGVFGSSAAYVVGDNFPQLDTATANATLSITGASRGVLATPTADRRALLKTEPLNAGVRVAGYAYTTSSMTVSYNPGDLVQHQLTMYFADYENYHRTESVTLYNANTNTVLTHQVLTNFRQGKYLTYDVSGPVLIVITNGTTTNAVLSGLFID